HFSQCGLVPAAHSAGLIDFKALAPAPWLKGKGDEMTHSDQRKLPRINSVAHAGFAGPYPYETDLTAINGGPITFPRVNAYGFRGETRPRGAIKGAGGFLPNYTRPAHIATHAENYQKAKAANDQSALDKWKQAEQGALNLPNFIKDQTFKGFISTT